MLCEWMQCEYKELLWRWPEDNQHLHCVLQKVGSYRTDFSLRFVCVMELKSSQSFLKIKGMVLVHQKFPSWWKLIPFHESLQFINVDSQVGGGGAVLLWSFIIKAEI